MSQIAQYLNCNAFTEMQSIRNNHNHGIHMYHCPLKVTNSFNLSQLVNFFHCNLNNIFKLYNLICRKQNVIYIVLISAQMEQVVFLIIAKKMPKTIHVSFKLTRLTSI